MSVLPVFRDIGQPQPSWSDSICDEIRKRMKAEADKSPVLRKGGRHSTLPHGGTGAGDYQLKRGEELRARLSKQVLAMSADGLSIPAISRYVGCAHTTVRRIIAEAAL